MLPPLVFPGYAHNMFMQSTPGYPPDERTATCRKTGAFSGQTKIVKSVAKITMSFIITLSTTAITSKGKC